MIKQVFVFCFMGLGLFFGSLKLFAAENQDFPDKDKPFSHRAEQGLDAEKPSRLTFYGNVETMGLIGGSNTKTYDNFGVDKKVVNNALGAHFSGNFGFLWELTPFTGANLKLETHYDTAEHKSKDNFLASTSPYVSVNKFVAYSDIAGELGSKYFSTKLSMGLFNFDRKSFAIVDAMGTKLSNRHQQSDQLNAKLELSTRNLFPIKLVLASDMDFGINREYNKLHWNNKGSSYLVDLQSAGFKIEDIMTLNWNTYYGYSRTATQVHYLLNLPNIGPDNMDILANYLNKLKHTVGATIGVSIPVGDLITISAGAAVEYNSWKFVGPDIPAVPTQVSSDPASTSPVVPADPVVSPAVSSLSVLKGQNFGSFEWHVGAKMQLKNILELALAVRQDVYNHVEYARLNKKAPNTEFVTGLSVEYLQLKELTKLTFYLGVGAGFGSLFASEEYKRARHGVDTSIYSGYAVNDKTKGAINGIANYPAGNQLSADFGVGYHPVADASIYLGYQYGRYGVKGDGGKGADFTGSPGQVYIAAKYNW